MTRPRSKLLRSLIVFGLVFGVIAGTGWAAISALHLQRATVTSGSMQPYMWEGTRVIIREGVDIKRDDIIAFHNPETGGITTHVFGGYASDGTLMTRGSWNDEVDSFTPAPTRKDVIGKVVYHTSVFTERFWYTPRGMGIVLLLSAAIILMVLSWQLGRDRAYKAKTEVLNPV